MLRPKNLMNLSERVEAKYWDSWLSFLVTFIKREYEQTENCLEFVILCSNRWLKIEVTARQNAYLFRVVVFATPK